MGGVYQNEVMKVYCSLILSASTWSYTELVNVVRMTG